MNWRVGQRVCREEASEKIGRVTEVSRREIRVEWVSGATSYYQLDDGYVPVKDAKRPPKA
jgi:hypothetical protein